MDIKTPAFESIYIPAMPIISLLYHEFIEPLLGIGVFTALIAAAWKHFTERKIERLRADFQKELSAVNSRLDKKKESFVHVFKAKFDLEIRVYQEIWSTMFDLRDATLQMAPRVEDVPAGQTEEARREVLIGRHQKFVVAYNSALLNWVKYEPFYPEDIHKRIDMFMKAAQKEGNRIKLCIQAFKSVMLEEKEKYLDELERSYEVTCNLIRSRLDQISIIDENELPEEVRIR